MNIITLLKIVNRYRLLICSTTFLFKTSIEWRKKNKHNKTVVANRIDDGPFPIGKVKVGKYTYGPLRVIQFNEDDPIMSIGNFVSIAKEVTFLLGGEHSFDTISTYPFMAKFHGKAEALSKGPIIIEDDVWIGYGSTILSGVKLAKGTVVAAGSVVVHSTEPYSVVGGIPAKIIKYRFDEKVIDILNTFDFGVLDDRVLTSCDALSVLYTKIDDVQTANHVKERIYDL